MKFMFSTRQAARFAMGAALALGGSLYVHADAAQDLIAAITGPSPEAAIAAAQASGPAGAAAIVPLGQLVGHADPLVVKHARMSLVNVVHHAARWGADAEKQAVAAELQKLLAPEMPEFARRDALQLLGFAGCDADVPAMAGFLKDPVLVQDAAMGLARIKATNASKALADALKDGDAAAQQEIITALSDRNDPATGPAILAFAEGNETETGWQAMEILAGFGLPPNEVLSLKADTSLTQHARYLNAYIKAGDKLADNKQPAGAENMYARVLALDPAPHQVSAVLLGFKAIGSEKLISSAIAALDTPVARDYATEVLVADTNAKIDEKLGAAFAHATGGSKAGILEVLAARKSANLPALLEQAKADGDPVVRMIAANLAGVAPAEADVEAAIASPMPWFRAPAMKSYLMLADAKLAGGDAAGALAMYEAVINGEGDSDFKILALNGVGQAAQPTSRELVTKLMDDSILGEAAGRALVDIAAKQEPEAAKNELLTLAETAKQSIASYAIEKLQPMGIGTEAIPQRKGFITAWKALGPLPNAAGGAFEKSFFPEGQAELANVDVDGKTYSWTDIAYAQVPAIFNLKDYYKTGEDPVVAYVSANITVGADTPVVFLVGSNDGCEFFVNGERLHAVKDSRPLTLDGDRVEATLKTGVNRVLLKVLQDGGAWEFSVRVTNPDGSPFDMSAHK